MAHNQKKNQSIKTDSEMTEIMELMEKNFKTTITNMLKDLKKKYG